MSDTQIPVDNGTKKLLEQHKREGESWDDTLLRLALMDTSEGSPVDRIPADSIPEEYRPDTDS